MQKANIRPGQAKGFWNNYLTPMLAVLAALFSLNASAQIPDSTKPYGPLSSYLEYRNSIRVNGSLRIPYDTVRLRQSDTGSIARIASTIYIWRQIGSTLKWVTSAGSGGGGGTFTSIGLVSSTLTVLNSPLIEDGNFIINLSPTTIVAGSYTYASVTFDQYGRATAASNGVTPLLPSDSAGFLAGYTRVNRFLDSIAILRDLFTSVSPGNFYIQNGPLSVNLDSLGYVINDTTLGIKSFGIVAGTNVTISKLVGPDSIQYTINASGGATVFANNGLRMDGDTVKLENAFTANTEDVFIKAANDKTFGIVDFNASHGLTIDNSSVTIANNAGNVFGVSSSVNGYGWISGHTAWNNTAYTTDTNLDLTADPTWFPHVKLTATLTANRTLTMPVGAIQNEFCTLVSITGSAFKWQLAGADVYELDGTQITELNNNETYDLVWNSGTSKWYRKSGGTSGGVSSLAAIGAVPNANGGSISAGVLTLQPADQTHGGVLTSGTQDIGGNKDFYGGIGFQSSVAYYGATNVFIHSNGPLFGGSTTTANRPTLVSSDSYLRWNDDSSRFEGGNVATGWQQLAFVSDLAGLGGVGNLIIQNKGTGQQTWYTSGDTLYMKKFKNYYGMIWDTDTDSSVRGKLDTATIFAAVRATIPAGGGTPAGSTGQVQINSSGAFSADATLTHSSANRALTIGGAPNTGANLQVSNDNTTLHATTTAAVAPATALFVAGNSHGSIIQYKAGISSTLRESHTFMGSRGTLASPTTVASDDDLGGLTFGGYTGTAYVFAGAIDGIVDGTVTSTNVPTAIHIFTSPNTSLNRLSRFKVANDGEIIMAANARTFTDKGTYNLQVEGNTYTGGRQTIAVTTYTDANVASVVGVGIAILPTITANRTITLANGVVAGELFTVHNTNSAAFAWNITGTVQDAAGAAITSFTNDTVYRLFWNGSAWVKMN